MLVNPGSLKVPAFRIHTRLLALWIFLLLAGGFGQAQAAGITLVQHIGKDAGTTTTSTLAFPGANAAGNFIAVVIRGGLSNSQVFTVKDSNANTYKQAKQIGSSGSQVTSAIYYAENIAGGSNTITVTMTVSGPLRIAILEYSGVATSNSLDATVAASTTSTSPNSSSLTTSVSGDLLLGEVATADSVTFTGGAGFTVRDFVPAEPNTKLITEDQIQATAGTAAATATLNPSSNWAALLAAFKPAGGVAGSPASITASAGTPQSATVGTSFGIQLQATVKDSFNNPVNGATVTFTAPVSGAGGTFAGGVTTATTNAQGVATAAVFTANTTAGGYAVTASVSGVASPANFSLTNLAGAASSITATSGTPQSATVNTAFATQLQATVKDSFGNAVSGAIVTFTAPGSGASGAFAGGVNTATTNASGVATAAAFTANTTAGGYAVTASVSGVASPANYSLTNLAGAAASITATAGTPQNATINTVFTTQLQATIKDSFNNPVSGVTVAFTAPGSGASGTFAGGVNTATTNALGVATAAVFTANGTAGSYTVAASVSGVASPANFSLTNLALTPTITGLNPASGQLGASVTITGTNFGATQGTSTVTFNGINAGSTSWSNTSITTVVPDGATSGNVVVTVAGVPSNGVNFTLSAPVISSVGPTSGGFLTPVSISGTGFGFSQGSSTVSFAGTLATPTSWNMTSITVPVPTGATSGNVVVTVDGLPSNGVNFAVLPISVSVSPASPTVITNQSAGYAATVQGDTANLGVTWSLTGAGCSGSTCGTLGPATSNHTTAYTAPPTVPNPPTVTITATSVADPTKSATSTVTIVSPTPHITSVSPANGPVSTQVTITGTGFGAFQQTSTVAFNGVQAGATSWSDTSIVAIVPTSATTGNVVVTVSGTPSNGLPFTIVPNITSLSPTAGPFGTSVTITGTTFGASQGTSTVTFNGTAATPTSWSATSIVVPVPVGAITGNVVVSVNGVASNGANFTVTPGIASLSPASGPVGTSVTITGTNFGATQGTSTVTFANVIATPTSWSATSIVVPVPTGVIAGPASVVVTVGGLASNAPNFGVAPAITSLSPSSGPVGTSVTINGSNFGASKGFSSISFNGIPTAPVSWSDTSIVISVPTGATTGNVVVTVGSIPSNGVSFTVTPSPSITNVSPSSGPVGTIVTITGSNFGATQGTSTVSFNGMQATPTSWSASSIVVPVPSGASTGPLLVNIGGVFANSSFTVTPPLPNIATLSPNSGTIGTSVTISGTNFGANQGTSFVTFSGIVATPTSWSDTTIAVSVPSAATTGSVIVTVGAGGTGYGSNGVPFTVLPSITSLSPGSGPLGQSVVINGGGFGSTQGTSTVSFNGVSATPISWGSSTIVTPLPAGADTGNVIVTVGGVASNAVAFTVIPSISSLSPAAASIGTSVTITGNAFGPTQGASTVTFNGTPATPTTWSDTNITAPVPTGATTGSVFVTVAGQVSNGLSFTVTPVTITSLSPTSGPVGTLVTITGTNLGGTQGTSVVTFNGVVATPTNWTASGITVPVPAGAASGNVVVTVGGIASNGVPFTVPTPPANIALVQHVGKDAGTTTTTTLAFNSANTAGNFIAVVIRGGNSNAQVFTVKDSNSNTYKQAKQLASSGSAVTSAIYYAENVKSGANTVTVTMTVSGPLRIDILEYSGVATSNSLDATVAATTTSTSPNTGSLTTTVNGDLLLGEVSTADSTTFTAGSGYTIRDFVPVEPNTKLITEDQIQSTAGTASATATLNPSSNWGAILAAFKAASGTGGGAGIPASITATAGTPQSATVNTAFAAQLQATVKDSLNNPVSGVTVTFTAPGSGASVVFSGGATTAVTNASGVATSALLTANARAGVYTVTASVSGVVATGNFSLTNLAGGASSIVATAGTPQSATINTAFSAQFQATVKDSFNNSVSGVTVIFNAPLSGASGTFPGGLNTATTNAQGVATANVFTANGIAGGPYTVTASVSGVASPANFSLTNVSAPPASIAATAGTPQSATVNTAFTAQLQATVKDASNNPVSGVTVTFTAPVSGASGTFAGGVNTATTNSLGVATSAVFTANTTAGAYAVTASVSGVATPANFSLTNLAGSAANISATAGTPQSAVINTTFAAPLQAAVTDSLNNPVGGVTVTFTAPGSGASGTFAGGVNTATTNAQGIATAPAFTANSTVGGPYTVTASASGVVAQVNFSLTNLSAVGNITLVQHRNMDASTQTNNSLAFANNTTAGNFIAVAIRGSASSSQVFTVSDSNGNTYHQAFSVGLTASLETFAIFYAENIRGGADRITVSQSVLGTLRFAILEYSGVATSNSLDGAATAQGNNASPNSGNLTTTANGDLLLANIITKNNGTYTAAGGFNIEETVQPAPNTKVVAEDQLQTAAGTVSAGVSLTASDIWGAGLAAFRSISGAVAPISVSISPGAASLPAGYGAQAFTDTVTNDFLNRGATWSLSGAGCSGATCGALSKVTANSVTYTAPSNIPSPATVTLTATSVGDTTKSASATITVTQGVLAVVLTPKRAAVTLASSPVQFAANVFNDPQNLGVTWQVDGNNGGTSVSGTISATGLYTPGTQPGQHTITAVSNANASVSGSALMAVTDLLGVYTNHNDNARTGQNLQEYGLTSATVTPSTFGQLFSCPVDGYVYAQPLWVASLNFGGTTHNVAFIATEHDSVYAFDADSQNCIQLWQKNFLSSGVTTLTSSDVNTNTDIIPEIGITSTPVIDPATNTLYVVPKTRETVGTVNGQACSSASPCYVHRLHALDLITGAEKFGGPVVISATNFTALKHLQRPALLLANNTVYLAFGSHGDLCNYQGWLMGYNAGTLAQTFATAVSNPASGCNQGAIWQSGGGPSSDASGKVYVVTANGLYDGTSNFGDTVLKFNSTGAMPPADWFTPFNQATLAANDVDLGSAAVLILPDAVGSAAHPHLAITTGKDAVVYLLDQTNMGKFNSSSNNDVQELVPVPPANTTLDDGGNYIGPAYWNGNIYLTGQNYPLMQFQIANGVIATPQFASSSNTFPPRGGAPVVSANGTTGGIVWIIDYSGFQDNTPAILDAYDANNVGALLFSSLASGAGAAGNGVKFTVPTVANAKVYVGGQFVFTVYGLLPN